MSDNSIWTSDSAYFFGFLSSVLLSLTPIIQIIALISKQINIEIVNLFPLICLYANCGLFFFQQLIIIIQKKSESGQSLPILQYCNLIGFCLSLVWCIIIIYYQNIKSKLHFWLYVLLLIVATVIGITVEFLMKELSFYKTFINIIASIFNVLMYLSCGLNTVNLFRTKNFNYISILYVTAGLINCVIWLIFGCLFGTTEESKFHVIISNILGIIITILQMVVYFKYRKEYIHKYNIETSTIEEPIKENVAIEGQLPDDIGDI